MGRARTICLVGHSGCGKTTLAAALMTKAGVKGPIELDASQEEKERGYSIDMSFGTYASGGATITLLDTPGGDEFVEEMYKGIPVADLTLLVVGADKPVEVMTERAWALSAGSGRPTAVLVNQMDKENANFARAMDAMREAFEGKLIAVEIPIRDGASFVGIVDLLRNQAVYFGDKSKTEIPADLADIAEAERSQLIEEISTVDEDLMMRFLEDEPISDEELATTLGKGIASGELVPVLCASGLESKGLESLSKLFEALDANRKDDGHVRAVVFELATDPYLGRLTYVRVLEGTLQEGKHLVDVSSGSKVDVRDIYALDGTKQARVPQAVAGDVVALGKIEDIALGTTIGLNTEAEAFEMPAFPKPVYARSIVPKSQADVEKMSEALREVAGTKATVEVGRDPVTKEMLIQGMGDIHLSVLIERMKNRYNVNLETHQPKIAYKETIRKKATARYRHKKQSGGRGQFGECELRLDPFDGGYQFLDEIKGASIPGQYVPGVEKGVVEAMEEGNLAKYPVTNVSVAVFDGQYHPVDSSELAFKLAARNAFREAFDKASPCLLEPVMSVDVRIPEEYTGDIISDLNGRRGRIHGMEPSGKVTVVHAEAPLSEMQSYALDLKSRTQGRATFQMEFLKYAQVPGNLQEKIVAQAQAAEE